MKPTKYVKVSGNDLEEIKTKFAQAFTYYYHGVEYACEAVCPMDTKLFGIRQVDFHWNGNKNNQKYLVTIQLSRPGIFIGRKGENIENLTKYIKDKFDVDVRFSLIECDEVILEMLHGKKLETISFEQNY